jgi:hypothetical protein
VYDMVYYFSQCVASTPEATSKCLKGIFAIVVKMKLRNMMCDDSPWMIV